MEAKRRDPSYQPRRIGDRRVCKFCGRKFTSRNVNQQLCSEECRRGHRSRYLEQRSLARRPYATCAECGEQFRPTRVGSRFCSKRCSDAVRQRLPEQRRNNTTRRLKRLYGIDLDTVEQLLVIQSGRCLTCGRHVSFEGNDRAEKLRNAPRVDHDHGTGAVRGLLCYWCNVMLGQVQDNPVVLQRMIEYLLLGSDNQEPADRVATFLRDYPFEI